LTWTDVLKICGDEKMKQRLNEIPVQHAIQPSRITVTMSPGQWDALLEAAYDQGHVLLELDNNEMPLRAYQKNEV
jgi:hypothetical protein